MANKRKPQRAKPANDREPLVNEFAARHGMYRDAFVPDPEGMNLRTQHKLVKATRNLAPTIIDKWLVEGGPGFDEPQGRAIDHVRGLWVIVGEGPRVIANYTGVGGGQGDREGYMLALHTIGSYEREFPPYVWSAFEAVVRWDEPAGKVGSRMANHSAEQRAHAKACVGFVASKIAEWRGY